MQYPSISSHILAAPAAAAAGKTTAAVFLRPPHVHAAGWRICAVSVCCLAVLPFFMLAAMVVDGRRDAASAGGLRRRWSTETFIYSSLSVSVVDDHGQLLVCSSTSSTSFMRPFLKSAVAAILAGIGASGVVPATVLGNGKLGFLVLLDGGEREGLWCNFYFSVRSFLLLSGTHVLLSLVMGSSVLFLYTRCMV